jgi:hypothetical protein
MTTNDGGNTGAGGPLTDTDVSTINIAAINDAPVNTLPASFATTSNTAVKLVGLSVSDVDAGSGTITVTLSVTNGTLTGTTSGGVTVTGSGTGSLLLTGTLSNINAYLASSTSQPSYVPATNASGSFTLTMTTNDGGNTGSGGPLTDTDVSTITVTATDTTPPTFLITSHQDNNSSASTLTITFSEPMQAFFDPSKMHITGQSVIVGTGTWNADFTVFTIQVTKSGNNGSTYNVSFDPGAFKDVAGNNSVAESATGLKPAGIAGEDINLGLMAHNEGSPVTVHIASLPSGWVVQGAVLQADGSWLVVTDDVSKLAIVTPTGFSGAELLNISMSWTNADGTTSTAFVSDNVEAYAPGNPIFAWSGDDTLSGSSGADTFVFSQPIGSDTVQSFDVSADKIDLVAYAGLNSFADVLAHLSADANGNALLTLGNGQTITIIGVPPSELTAANFEFNVTPTVENAGDMTVGDGALLPLSGIIDNAGTISLGAQGATTTLELIQNGITLQGGGNLTLSDSAYNVISGSLPSVTFNNVDNVISGAGQLGGGSLSLTNGGTIIASGVNALVIDTGSNVVVNTGTIEATGSGGLEILSSIVNSGLIMAEGGSHVFIGGDVSGAGHVEITGAASVELVGGDTNNVVIDANASAALVLDDATQFTGAISGLNSDDSVDLRDVAFGANTTTSYADNGHGGGVLTVSDGVNTVQLALVGDYQSQNFSLASDGQGGTLLINNAIGVPHYSAGEIIDVSQALNVAAGTDVIADGYLRVTTSGLVQVDGNGGGDNWVTLGDVNTGGPYTVSYLSNGVPATISVDPVAPPIGIDLNGDGVVSFLGTEAGVTFDYGFGTVATAWVAPQDGILVRDANGDGKATAEEIVFSTGGSDLQGLAQYDTNHDGQLDAADAAFSQFAVWQDANSNGLVDPGEMKSLMALGITSISLSSDGVSYSAAGGDVSVVGNGTVTYADGRSGVLADAVFATGAKTAAIATAATSAGWANSNNRDFGQGRGGVNATNAVLMGALAASATGLVDLGIENKLIFRHGHSGEAQPLHSTAGSDMPANSTTVAQTTHIIVGATSTPPVPNPVQQTPLQHEFAGHDNNVSFDHVRAQLPGELVHGGDHGEHVPPPLTAVPLVAMSVTIPSAEQLAAAAPSQLVAHSGGPSVADLGHAGHDHIAHVLADVLHIDGHGSHGAHGALEALINALPLQGQVANPLGSLAAHASALVDIGHFAGLSLHGPSAMDHMMMHPDAAHPHG